MGIGLYGAPMEWYERNDAHEQIGDLIAWLHDTGRLNHIDEAVYVARKPWKHEAEYRQMLKARSTERAA